jgi:ribosomal protein S27AE
MREIRYYVADDGERFNTERECVEYEQKSKLRRHKDEFKIFRCGYKSNRVYELYAK